MKGRGRVLGNSVPFPDLESLSIVPFLLGTKPPLIRDAGAANTELISPDQVGGRVQLVKSHFSNVYLPPVKAERATLCSSQLLPKLRKGFASN